MEPSGRWQRFIPAAADTGVGSSAMTAESHYTECCERFLDLVGEAAELLHAKANNYLDSDLARTASSLIDVSYQLRKEVLVDKATAVLASALINNAIDPYELAKPIITQIREIDQAYHDYRRISGTEDYVEI
jgi:hypothetical protein